MAQRDLSGLSASQRAARARNLGALREYRKRGRFPHNHVSRSRTPVFVDEHGTRCAMAYLIEQSGRTELVTRIGGTRNLARIRELSRDPDLVSWLELNGITLGEAARIQPMYDDPVVRAGDPEIYSGVAGAVFGGTGTALNLHVGGSQNSRNTRGLVGVLAGLLGMGLGAPALGHVDRDVQMLGAFDFGLGIASIGLGIRQLSAGDPHRKRAALVPMAWSDARGVRRVALTAKF